ncbi:hypothetical protein JHK84_053029 [Glycine max]|nr:hypothetical protein JHK86_053002 [Glycine max]KAG4927376.1 hypothetical protein JHK85_053862 [Glycine max]KAG5082991.1 hypothetical protein JHK84_053029 [Glycine max]
MEIINPITKEKTYVFPVGYKFDPNDDDLVSYYLRKKIIREQLPEKLIQESDVVGTEPWGLPGDELARLRSDLVGMEESKKG